MQQQTSKASHAVTANAPARAAFPPPAVRPHRDRRDSPGRYASADLAAEPAAAGRARSLTRDTLARWHLDHLTDDAEAIASELITNAVDKAQPPRATLPAIIFAIHRRPGELHIIVWDNGPGHPARTDAGADAEAGRGLAIVDSLSGQKWGWWPTPRSGGKVVWAALTAPAAAPAPDAPAPATGCVMTLPKHERAAAIIRDRIAAGALRPGRPAPSGAELARATGYAQPTCRRALRALFKRRNPGAGPQPQLPPPRRRRRPCPRPRRRAIGRARRPPARRRPDPARAGRPRRPLRHHRRPRRDRPPMAVTPILGERR